MGLVIGEPLLEKGGEGVSVDDLLSGMVPDDELAVAPDGHFRQSFPFAPPMRHLMEFIDGDFLMVGVSCKDVIHPEGGISEEAVEILGFQTCTFQYHASEDKKT